MTRTLSKAHRRFARRPLEIFASSHICFEPLEPRTLLAATPIQQLATANNQFAIDLYRKLATESGNIFFSPYSISSALDMTLQGANGQTARQMIDVLHLPAEDIASAGAKALFNLLNTNPANAGYEVSTANRLWGANGFLVSAEFQQTLQELFSAKLESIDFSDVQNAIDTINAWVSEKTKGNITDLITPDMITPLTRLILVNAIYFKANWAYSFDPALSNNSTFHLNANIGQEVKMMHKMSYFNYYEDNKMQALGIPYKGSKYEMLVMLPKSIALNVLESSLTEDYLATVKSGGRWGLVDVSLPAFEMSGSFDLKDTLSAMGMPLAFSNGADFSGISSNLALHIEKVVHKATIKVNESGSEATGSTAVSMGLGGAMNPAPPKEFVANHPFLLAIREYSTGAILFMGRLSVADENAATFRATFRLGVEDDAPISTSPISITPPGGLPIVVIPPNTNAPPSFPSGDARETPPIVEDIPPTITVAPAVLIFDPAAIDFSPRASSLNPAAGVTLTPFTATMPAHYTDYSPYYTYVGSDQAPPAAEAKEAESLEETANSEDQQSSSAEKDKKDDRVN